MMPRLPFFVLLASLLSPALQAAIPLAEKPAHFLAQSQADKQALSLLLAKEQQPLSIQSQDLVQQLQQRLGLVVAPAFADGGDCLQVIDNVADKKTYYDISLCLLETSQTQAIEKAARVDQSIVAFVDKHSDHTGSQWLAYAYYNLAILALTNRENNLANGYFDKALGFAPFSDEGRGLYSRIWLERAYAEYESNQFVSAMEAFKHIGLDSTFKSEALLGYGWAAFYSYERGVALEAWRQIALQKNKSMSVYEALLAIPFALEKANAFSRSLTAYEYAISEYEQALKHIDALEQHLTLDAIQSYVAGQRQSVPELLPELLGVAFTRKAFRTLIDEAIALREQGQLLGYQLQKIDRLEQLAKNIHEQNTAGPNMPMAKPKQKLTALSDAIVSLRLQFVAYIAKQPKTSVRLQSLVQQYMQLQAMASADDAQVQTQLKTLQTILLVRAYQENVLSQKTMDRLTGLVEQQRYLASRIQGFEQSHADLARGPMLAHERFASLRQRVELLQTRKKQQSLAVQKKLLQMTLAQLGDYRKQIEGFSKQARVASARLQEEFYQLGEHK